MTTRYRSVHGVRNFYVNVAGWFGSVLGLCAITTPAGQFGSQFVPPALLILAAAGVVLLRGRSMCVEVEPGRLVAHGFWVRTELTGELRTTVKKVRPGKTWLRVTDGTRTVTLPRVVNIAKPLNPRLNLYPPNTLEVRAAGARRWRSTDIPWGSQAMVDALGVGYPELGPAKPSRPPMSPASTAVLSVLLVSSGSFLVAYSVAKAWPLLVISLVLVQGAVIVVVRSRRHQAHERRQSSPPAASPPSECPAPRAEPAQHADSP